MISTVTWYALHLNLGYLRHFVIHGYSHIQLDFDKDQDVTFGFSCTYVLVISQYEYDILVITQVRGEAEDEC